MREWDLARFMPLVAEVRNLIPVAFLKYLASIGWNQYILSFKDILSLYQLNGIVLAEMHMYHVAGMFSVFDHTPVVLLSSLLTEPFKTFVAVHQFVHYNLDSSDVCCYGKLSGRDTPECRANIIASCALIPTDAISSSAPANTTTLDAYPSELITFRKSVYSHCGF